jgi:L-threonylcarbamoyladenylate synthase
MHTTVLRIDPQHPDPSAIERAARVLLSGGLVAFPTETVYGLGALADDATTVARIYAAKGRPSHNPLIAHVPGEPEARRGAGSWPEAAARLARAFWPGPLTLVVPRGPTIPAVLSAGLDTMALRAPRHPVALALLRAVGRPVAAPSANLSTQLSPTRAEHVLKGLDGRIEMVLDAGPCPLGIESTVVDVTRDPPQVLRPGSLGVEELAAVLPEVLGPDLTPAQEGTPRSSPGLERKHYAPRARLVLAPRGDLLAVVERVEAPVGVVTRGAPLGLGGTHERTLPADPAGYAATLFDALHALDDAGCRTIVVEAVPLDPAWTAVRDRLDRASAS